MFKDRIVVFDEDEYDGDTHEFFPLSSFPYPDELEEVYPSGNPLPEVGTEEGRCFVNALRIAEFCDAYEIAFGYFGTEDRLTPHCFSKLSQMYFEVTPVFVPAGTRYFKYCSMSRTDYMALLREQLGSDFKADQKQYPISVDKDGNFVFVRVRAK